MTISKELAIAFRRLQVCVIDCPAEAWADWTIVSETIGHDMITLIDALVHRTQFKSGEREMAMQSYPAYGELAKVAQMDPWNQMIELNEDKTRIRLCESIRNEALEDLLKIIHEEIDAIT